MIITKLELAPWMKLQNLALEFNPGINLIYGPNEIGKSSIKTAIHMALTGDAGSGKSEYKELQPWGTRVKSNLTLHFTTWGGHCFQLKKSFPKGSANLYENSVKISEGAKETQKELYKLLGISEKTEGLLDLLFIDQGEALNIFEKNNNPLNEDTRSHIKNIIKETAFKEIEAFQNELNQERDNLFTNPKMESFRSGKNTPAIKQALDSEKELREKLQEIEQKEAESSQLLEEIQNLDNQNRQLRAEKKIEENNLVKLNTKVEKLRELEKKKLAFKPIMDHYENFIGIQKQLSNLNRNLPQHYAQAKNKITVLEEEISQKKEQLKKKTQYQKDLRQKKKQFETFLGSKIAFEKIEKEYRNSKQKEEEIRENDKQLPSLFAINRVKLKEEARDIQSKINRISDKKEEIQKISDTLKSYPLQFKKNVTCAKKIDEDLIKLQNELNAAQSAIKLQIDVTPSPGMKPGINLVKDENETIPYTLDKPLKVEDFQQLAFQYPDHFDIRFSGNLEKIDMDSLREKLRQKKEELSKLLQLMEIQDIEELENKFKQYTEANIKKTEIENQLEPQEKIEKLISEKSEIETSLAKLEQDIVKYLGKEAVPKEIKTHDPLSSQSTQETRDNLTKAKVNKDNHQLELSRILNGRTSMAIEEEYQTKEIAYKQLQKTLKTMPPQDIAEVTQEHLDKVAEDISTIERRINKAEQEKNLLKDLETYQDAPIPTDTTQYDINMTPQQIRDSIKEKLVRKDELINQRDGILKGRKSEDMKDEYQKRKDEIKTLSQIVTQMEPLNIKSSSDAQESIKALTKKQEKIKEKINANENRKSERSGEIKSFEGISEEKGQAEYNYKQKLDEIKTHLTEIYSLKLLLKMIDDEKEKAQKEIFKPLEDKIMRNFKKLIPTETYKIGIDNNLGMTISARGLAGDFLGVSEKNLSFGTREQLSFLLRLAIAEQLSLKEPQVMILDDSFVNTDNSRLSSLLNIINQHKEDIQFLIFTCKQDDYLKYKSQFHTLNLGNLVKNGT